jgi:lipopolysaccharide transport system permease protein
MNHTNDHISISPKGSVFNLNLVELWDYRDLILLFVKRDIVASYKQTLLGPLWFFLAPLFTVLVYNLVFKSIAGISTDGTPSILFYLSGIILWNYFQSCFNSTSSTFVSNAGIFGKVYFPRLVSPISIVISNLVKLFIQMSLFLGVLGYYLFKSIVHIQWTLVFFPLLLLILALLALAFGLLTSSLTTKYRDLNFFISFGISLIMYLTPVIYPLSSLPVKYAFLLKINPLTPIFETFRYSFTGHGVFSFGGILYSLFIALISLLISIVFFNRTERTFMDTV